LKETKFIEQNKEKWSRFEKAYSSSQKDPEELTKLYLDITEDLGYAQTFYNRRTVRVYLNQLAQKVFSGVHKQGGESWRRILEVISVSIPLEVYRSRKTILFAFISFLIYAAIGVVTTYFNPDFPRIVMGDMYVDMTIENIAKGNPLAVYESQSQLSMFVHITTNNLKVALLTFFAGFFATVGTHLLLFSNGVMLGAFQYFFQTKGLLITSFLGIWIHGAFEISAIVLAGGAGITAGNGWLFPKSYTRLQSLKLSTMRGLKIMLSLLPFIVIAGILESYVTRHYQLLPEWSKWCIILFSFAMIVFYYVIYPFIVARKYAHLAEHTGEVEFREKRQPVFYKLRSEGEMIKDAFSSYFIYSSRFFRIIFTLVFPLGLAVMYFQGQIHMDRMLDQHWFDWYAQAQIMFGYGLYHPITDIIVGVVWSGLIALVFSAVFWSLKSEEKQFSYQDFFRYLKQRFVRIYFSMALFYWLFFFTPMEVKFLLLFLLPFLTTNIAVKGLSDGSNRLKKVSGLAKKTYGSSLVILLFFPLTVVVFIQPISLVFSIHEGWSNEPTIRDLLDIVTDFINRAAIHFTEDYMYYSNSFRQLIYFLFVLLTLPLFVLMISFSCFNILEREEVVGLRKEFESFGKRKRHQE
jgi:uncharacterized membrane protein SpoIIM required for sporulation